MSSSGLCCCFDALPLKCFVTSLRPQLSNLKYRFHGLTFFLTQDDFVILKCGSFVQVAYREYVVPSGRLTLSTRRIAPNPRGKWWRDLWSHLRALEYVSGRIRAAPEGNRAEEAPAKNSRE